MRADRTNKDDIESWAVALASPRHRHNLDGDGDGVSDGCDQCLGDDDSSDADGDGICADLDCDDSDRTNACLLIFLDGFESGDTLAWSNTVP